MTLSLLTLVAGVLIGSFLSMQKSEAYVGGRTAALDEMRLTMNRLTREVRQGSGFVGTPTASDLTVQTYVDGALHTVRYSAAGSTLSRSIDGGVAVVLQHRLADTDLFQYAPSADAAQVVTITLTVEPRNAPETTVTLDSEVRLRNLAEAS